MTGEGLDSIEHLLRELTPQVLGIVGRRFRDFAAAEDAVQEASIAAATQWPRDGLPDNPRAWLRQVAFRRMADQIRSESARRRRESEAAVDTDTAVTHTPESALIEVSPQEDDTLLLLFMCCHSALTPASAIALTLRAVGGLTTAEIAHAFLVPEPTMAQRISRAKQTIKDSGIPFQLPTAEERAQRLRAVLHVLYLIFNEGYTSSAGPHLQRTDLSHEAMRLTRIVHTLQPDDTEVAGLLALMLLTDARRSARTNSAELIPLAQQDRALWDKQQIAEGVALLSATLPKGSVGPYQLQAAIAAIHDEAARPDDTDWPPDSCPLRTARAHVRQPHGRVESRHRSGDGAGLVQGLGTFGRPQSGPSPCRSAPPGRRSRPSAGTRRGPQRRYKTLPRGGGQNRESP
jgi:RNA polymerase sigma factor (sigma-70 family)